jgi:hypothetical protein
MEELKRLDSSNAPVIKAVWGHAGDVVGIDLNGEPVILARLEDDEGAHSRPQEKRTRPPRKKKEPVVENPLE